MKDKKKLPKSTDKVVFYFKEFTRTPTEYWPKGFYQIAVGIYPADYAVKTINEAVNAFYESLTEKKEDYTKMDRKDIIEIPRFTFEYCLSLELDEAPELIKSEPMFVHLSLRTGHLIPGLRNHEELKNDLTHRMERMGYERTE
ncbi:MAG: hypothetical protein ACP5N3_01400 [Candidatus Nanoarchaeia archaeon]